MSQTEAAGEIRQRALIVDDSRMVRASIIKHIRDIYDVREEADGEAGWETLLLDPTIQVVISDLSMPKLDGYQLLERIRASKISRIHDMPVIMISGDEDDAARARAIELGATDFIAKGTGTAELLARLDGAIKATQTRRELEESRAALAEQRPIDPKYGLVTAQYLQMHGDQLLAQVRRDLGELSVMVIEVDRFDELERAYGKQVAALIIRKLAKILGTKVRKEDTVAQLGEARFCIVTPSINIDACNAFAMRIRAVIEGIALGYRGEVIHISLTIGIANSRHDHCNTIDDLIGLARTRVQQGQAEGGKRVVGSGGAVDRVPEQPITLERAHQLLESKSYAQLKPHVGALTKRLLAVLEFIEAEYQVGIPLEALAERCGGKLTAETSATTSRVTDSK
ncbi:MAG: response regulator [Rhodocyclaceae bacterium]